MKNPGTYAKGAARREEILEVALRMVAQDGARTSLRSIAREMGLEPAHVLYYFGSREELFREVIEGWDRHTDELEPSDESPLRKFAHSARHNLELRGLVHLYLSFAADSVDVKHPAHEFFLHRFERLRITLADAIRDGQTTGQLHPHLDPERSARQLIALADGLQLQSPIDPGVDAPGDLDAAINDLFV